MPALTETPTPRAAGPVLFARGGDAARVRLEALVVTGEDRAPAPLEPDGGAPVPAERAWHESGVTGWLYRFTLPAAADTGYRLDGSHYPVCCDLAGDLRIAFVSCNGQEEGDRARDPDERDALWRDLRRRHERAPFQLLLHGGDQLYADEVQRVHPLTADWEGAREGEHAHIPFDDEADAAVRRYLAGRYTEIYADPDVAWLLARVPSLMMWDDHDIIDGWGSLPERVLDSPVGQGLFRAARDHFLRFQLGAAGDRPPPTCLDPAGESLAWAVRHPGLAVVAPDLRSERRPDRVMGEPGWRCLERALGEVADGERLLLMSSVPALGPRLSWVEHVSSLLPPVRDYEDDLRDQWQSRAHREEWTRFLQALVDQTRRCEVTVLSGEIHLATRGEMPGHGRTVHQLVASGIAHPPPPQAYAKALGTLASLGEDPLPHHPVSLHPLPGRGDVYTADRNYLVLERRDGTWTACWITESGGDTPALPI